MIYDQHVAIVVVLLRADELQTVVCNRRLDLSGKKSSLVFLVCSERLSAKGRRRNESFILYNHTAKHEKSECIHQSSNLPRSAFSSRSEWRERRTSASSILFLISDKSIPNSCLARASRLAAQVSRQSPAERKIRPIFSRDMPDNPSELLKFIDEVQHYLRQTRNRRNTILATCLSVDLHLPLSLCQQTCSSLQEWCFPHWIILHSIHRHSRYQRRTRISRSE